MIHGYAYAKDETEARALPDDLRAIGAEKLWIDYPRTTRSERTDLFRLGLRPGDTLLLLSRAHLGHGREIPRFEALAEQAGVTVRVVEPEKPAPRKPGPAPGWRPTYAQERAARHWWHGPFRRADALRGIEAACGRKVSVAQLNRRLGPRSKPTPWINEKPEGDD